jgi:hypothetical protein
MALSSPAQADSTFIPDPTLIPGAVRTADVGEICSTGTRQLRHWDRARDDRIMAAYGLPAGAHPDWEIDHLVPLGIGEADAQANLWPEPRGSIEAQWNAEAKDRLENRRTASPVPAGRFACPPSLPRHLPPIGGLRREIYRQEAIATEALEPPLQRQQKCTPL